MKRTVILLSAVLLCGGFGGDNSSPDASGQISGGSSNDTLGSDEGNDTLGNKPGTHEGHLHLHDLPSLGAPERRTFSSPAYHDAIDSSGRSSSTQNEADHPAPANSGPAPHDDNGPVVGHDFSGTGTAGSSQSGGSLEAGGGHREGYFVQQSHGANVDGHH